MSSLLGIVSTTNLDIGQYDAVFKRCFSYSTRHTSRMQPKITSIPSCCFAFAGVSPYDCKERLTQPYKTDNILIMIDGVISNCFELGQMLDINPTQDMPAIIVKAYRKWGIQFINLLDGQYAIALYDEHTKSLYLISDHLNTKPIFYIQSKERFYFSSSLKLLTSILGFNDLYHEYFMHILLTETTGTPNFECTPYKGVKRLTSGRYLHLNSLGNSQITRYWDPESISIVRYNNERDYHTHYKGILLETINQQSRLTKPLVSSLSGGLDSSAITSILGLLSPNSFYTLSLDYQGDPDRPLRDTVLKSVNSLGHLEINIDDILFFTGLIDNPPILDEPYLDIEGYPLMEASSKVAASVEAKGIFYGYGADSLGSGNPAYIGDSMSSALTSLSIFSRLPNHNLLETLWQFGIKPNLALCKSSIKSIWTTKSVLPDDMLYKWLPDWVSEEFRYLIDIDKCIYNVNNEWARISKPSRRYIWRMVERERGLISAIENMSYLKRGLLHLNPFYSKYLVEFYLSVPESKKITIHNGNPIRKVLQRNALLGILPEYIRTNPTLSSGGHAYSKGLEKEFGKIVDLFHDPSCALVSNGVANRKELITAVERWRHGLDDQSLRKALPLEIWLRQYSSN